MVALIITCFIVIRTNILLALMNLHFQGMIGKESEDILDRGFSVTRKRQLGKYSSKKALRVTAELLQGSLGLFDLLLCCEFQRQGYVFSL